MTSRETAIDLDFWQACGWLALLVLAGCAAFVLVWRLTAWEMSLRERERMTQIGEAYCLGQRLESVYKPPTMWLADIRPADPLWLALDASLVAECGGWVRIDVDGQPFTLVNGAPLPPSLKPDRAELAAETAGPH